ncbi:MAG: efflux RND transporter periplasmic adaptor subunit, partial [Saprospiraceae bacterium]|nr:efflux RND transporter periplasmic adaptor subunit [Saprospiraceae bacterium]
SKLNIEKGERVVGTLQMAGTEIMRLAQMNSMEVQVDVSENDVLRLNVGNPAEIEVDAYVGRKFKGVVSEIANSASNIGSMSGGVATNLSTDQVTNFVVKIRIDPKSYSDLITATRPVPFRPGMSASVDITTNVINSTLCVPIQAVTTRDGSETTDDSKKKKKDDEDKLMSEEEKKLQEAKKREIKEVVFVKSADTVRLAEVKTGIQDDSYIQILSGLNKGETVVIGPYNTVARKLKSGDKVVLKTDDKKKE